MDERDAWTMRGRCMERIAGSQGPANARSGKNAKTEERQESRLFWSMGETRSQSLVFLKHSPGHWGEHLVRLCLGFKLYNR